MADTLLDSIYTKLLLGYNRRDAIKFYGKSKNWTQAAINTALKTYSTLADFLASESLITTDNEKTFFKRMESRNMQAKSGLIYIASVVFGMQRKDYKVWLRKVKSGKYSDIKSFITAGAYTTQTLATALTSADTLATTNLTLSDETVNLSANTTVPSAQNITLEDMTIAKDSATTEAVTFKLTTTGTLCVDSTNIDGVTVDTTSTGETNMSDSTINSNSVTVSANSINMDGVTITDN